MSHIEFSKKVFTHILCITAAKTSLVKIQHASSIFISLFFFLLLSFITHIDLRLWSGSSQQYLMFDFSLCQFRWNKSIQSYVLLLNGTSAHKRWDWTSQISRSSTGYQVKKKFKKLTHILCITVTKMSLVKILFFNGMYI